MAATEEEDFTFQTTTNTPPRFIDSPPLWRRTTSSICSCSGGSETKSQNGDERATHGCPKQEALNNKQRKSFQYGINGGNGNGSDDDNEEEKMDMLWEDLNEELSKRCGSELELVNSPGRLVELGVKAVFPGSKPPSTVAFLKVLKKLFLLHNFQTSLKKRTRRSK